MTVQTELLYKILSKLEKIEERLEFLYGMERYEQQRKVSRDKVARKIFENGFKLHYTKGKNI